MSKVQPNATVEVLQVRNGYTIRVLNNGPTRSNPIYIAASIKELTRRLAWLYRKPRKTS